MPSNQLTARNLRINYEIFALNRGGVIFFNTRMLAFLALFGLTEVALAQMRLPVFEHRNQPTSSIEVTTLRVLDGDTLEIDGKSQRVRIASIDAPETGSKKYPPQPYSSAAKIELAKILGPLPVKIQIRCFEKDFYERLVCDVYKGKLNVGLAMVERGYAWANMAGNGRYLRSTDYLDMQEVAKSNQRGLWREGQKATPPWVWRKISER